VKRVAYLLLLSLAIAVPSAAADVRVISGCQYGEGRLDRQFACAAPGAEISTSAGVVARPVIGGVTSDNVLGLRVTPEGEFRLAGQSHNGFGNWEWTASQGWKIVGPSYGVNPVLYDYVNTLHVGALSFGSQGLRFADRASGRLFTGDETYADPARRIGEWSTCGEVTVGQSGWSVVALWRGQRYTLERGSIVNIHLTCAGSQLAISYHRQDDRTFWFRWLDASELPAFPVEADPTNPPQPEVCGDGVDNDADGAVDEGCPTEPEPQPSIDLTQAQVDHLVRDQRDVIAGVKRDYPHLRGGEILDQAIHRLNAINSTDRYGRKARQSNGDNRNDDALTIRLKNDDHSQKKIIDALGNAWPNPDPSQPFDVPQWGVVPAHEEPGNGFWSPAARPNLDGTAEPEPDLSQLQARIRQLEADLAGRDQELRAWQEIVVTREQQLQDALRERDQARARVAELENRPQPQYSCEAKVPAILKGLGVKVGCRVFPTPPPPVQ
jgi:hypothetical protein